MMSSTGLEPVLVDVAAWSSCATARVVLHRFVTHSLAPLIALLAVLAFSSVPALAAAEGGTCPNEAIRLEQGSSRLPDCRAYEMVSPAYQEGYPLEVLRFAASGDQAVMAGYGNIHAAGEGEAVPEAAVYLAMRGVDGWGLESLNAPLNRYVGEIPVAYDAETSLSLWVQHTPSQSAPTRGLYIREANGNFSFVGPLTPGPESKEESGIIEQEDAGPDYKPIAGTIGYSHVVMSTEPTSGEFKLYEYSGVENAQPIAVNVSGAAKGSTTAVGECAVLGGNYRGKGSEFGALSRDGEKIFFTAPCSGPETNVYRRSNGSLASPGSAETKDVSESRCSEECGVEVSGKNFEGASETGEGAVFTSTQKLTDSAVNETVVGDATEARGCAVLSFGCNLYEYDFGLVGGSPLTAVGDGDVLGVAGMARDGSRVYFVDWGRLTEVPRGPCLAELNAAELLEEETTKEGRCRPKREADNLYAYNTTLGNVEFITTLSSSDSKDWERSFERPVQVTGEGGRFLLFASAATGLTGDDENARGIVQLFEYDAVTGELVRVTKGEDGYNENGNGAEHGISVTSIAQKVKLEGYGGVFQTAGNVLNVSGDGRTVVFETAGGLSPRAVSAADGCTSVYEFRSAGAIGQGSVHLISDGQDTQLQGEKCGAEFRFMDGSGANVLFTTADPLLPGDVDGVQRDIYDAREEGGFPPGPASTPECQGAGCQGTLSGPPGPTSPGSLNQAPEAPVPPLPPLAATPGTKIGTGTKTGTKKCAKGKQRDKRHQCVRGKVKKRKGRS
jgi:hypothetical protein